MTTLIGVGHEPVLEQANVLLTCPCAGVVLSGGGGERKQMFGVLRATQQTAIAVCHTTQCVSGLLRVPLKNTTPNPVFLSSLPAFPVQSLAAVCGDKVQ